MMKLKDILESVNEDYRDPKSNAEILKALLNDPKHSKYVTEELYQWLEDWDQLDEFVETMLDELNPDLGRYKLRNIRPESVNEETFEGEITKGLIDQVPYYQVEWSDGQKMTIPAKYWKEFQRMVKSKK